MISIQ
jgi:MFS family permease